MEGTGSTHAQGEHIHYEMGERNGAINCGGIGVFHQIVRGGKGDPFALLLDGRGSPVYGRNGDSMNSRIHHIV